MSDPVNPGAGLFALGQRVEWGGTAAGAARVFSGLIVEVVPAGILPRARGGIPSGPARAARDHESYIVRAGNGRRYWPRVEALGRAPEPVIATDHDRAILRAAEAAAGMAGVGTTMDDVAAAGARIGTAGARMDDLERRRSRQRGPGWLERIETLKPGDPCEVRAVSGDGAWLRAVVERNAMGGLWRVRVLATGEIWHPYIESVRCPGQTEAWPR
jgi:hypothetical protein